VQIHVLIKYILYRSCVDLNKHYIILMADVKILICWVVISIKTYFGR
jgi:hypothetical protein